MRVNFTNHYGKVVAWKSGDYLVKKVNGSKHMLKTPPAWAMDKAILKEAELVGCTAVKIIDTRRGGHVYTTALSAFEEKGFDLDYGYGEQRALALREWTVDAQGRLI